MFKAYTRTNENGKTDWFLKGMGSILNIAGYTSKKWRHEIQEDPSALDSLALRSDWEAVGGDFEAVLNYKEHLPDVKK